MQFQILRRWIARFGLLNREQQQMICAESWIDVCEIEEALQKESKRVNLPS
jgi:hypothetical protein